MLSNLAVAYDNEMTQEQEKQAIAAANVQESFSGNKPTGATSGSANVASPHMHRRSQQQKQQQKMQQQQQQEIGVCTAPSPRNPFMNVLLGEYRTNPTRPRACNHRDDKNIREDVNSNFIANSGAYYDVSDMYNRTQSQREYYTTANTTIPNKQHELAMWLYSDIAGRKRKIHA